MGRPLMNQHTVMSVDYLWSDQLKTMKNKQKKASLLVPCKNCVSQWQRQMVINISL